MGSKIKEKSGIFAIWKIQRVEKATGKILDTQIIKNLIVNAGLSLVRNLAGDLSSPDFIKAIAVGTGSTAATNTDTVLETEYIRSAATVSAPSAYVLRLTKTFDFGSGVSENITEAGCFDSATESGSTMFNRTVFSAEAISEAIDLIVTVDITFARV